MVIRNSSPPRAALPSTLQESAPPTRAYRSREAERLSASVAGDMVGLSGAGFRRLDALVDRVRDQVATAVEDHSQHVGLALVQLFDRFLADLAAGPGRMDHEKHAVH